MNLARVATLALLAAALVVGCKKQSQDAETPAAEAPSEAPEAPAAEEAPAAADPSEEPTGEQPAAEQAAADKPGTGDATAEAAPVREFKVNTASSKVDFLMEAPLENIHGVARKAVHGSVTMKLNDLSSIRGKIRVDLDKLELFQAKREAADGQFPDEEKNPKQNEHMKTWFQISPDAPQAIREKNRWIEFDVKSVSRLSATDVTALEGDKRSVRALVSGDFFLHGRTSKKNALLQATFNYNGDDVSSIRIRSLRPINVSLKAHDIRPRSAFDKLAQKTLAALGQKVAEAAPIKVSFTLRP